MSLRRFPLPLLFVALLAYPCAGNAAVSATVASGVLTVALDGADDATVACANGATKVNGADPTPAAACTAITQVTVTATGAFPNGVDLSGVTNALGFVNVLEGATGIVLDPSMVDAGGVGIVVSLGDGDDDYVGSNDGQINEVIEGGPGSDTIAPGFGVASLLFNAGNVETDTLLVTGANTELRFGGLTPVTVDLNGGVGGDPDAIASQASRVVKLDPASTLPPTLVAGGGGNDTIVGHATIGIFFLAVAGSDTFTGGTGDDFYFFGYTSPLFPTTVTIDDVAGANGLVFDQLPSNDPVTVDLTNGLGGSVFARNQSNTIVAQGAPATWASFVRVRGTDGNDTITGNAKNNVFVDCAGNDVYRGGDGDDLFDEKTGLLTVPGGAQFVDCGNDRYEGGDGDDDYHLACHQAAGLETKTLVELPNEGVDRIFHPRTTCVAGTTSTYDLRNDAALVRVGPSGGPARQIVESGAAGQAADFEDVFAGSNADTVTGNDGNNRLEGGSTGTLLVGGPGNDTFGTGGTVSYASAPGPMNVNLETGVATGEGTDDVSAVSRVIGSPFGDTIVGRSGSIVISGGGGDDFLFGEFQNVVNGDAGNDTITLAGGATGNGGADDDTLIALLFVDTLNGDAGNDTFILSGGLHTVHGGTGNDTIDARNERDDTIDCGDDGDVVHGDQDDAANGTCESVNAGGTGGAPDTTNLSLVSCGVGDVSFAAASADGSRVFFTTTEALVASDTDTARDIYEITVEGLRLVSGGSANVDAELSAISTDGSHVFFQTTEALPGTGDTDTAYDVYERADGVLRLVSGGTSNQASFFGGATADGSRVWFTSNDPLLPADTDTGGDLYERHGTSLTLISGPDAAVSFAFAAFGGATADGSTVWFTTNKGLVAGDTDGVFDVYQRTGGTLTRLTANGLGFNTSFSGVSADGTHVYFISDKGVPPTIGLPRAVGATTFHLYERSPNGVADLGANLIFLGAAADGGRVVVATDRALLPADGDGVADLYRLENGTTTLLSGGSTEAPVGNHALSADATRVVFETPESLLPADTDIATDVYLRDGATLTLLTPGTADVPAVLKGTADDATRVFFRTAEALVPEDTDTGIDVYEWSGGTVKLVGLGTGNLTTFFGGSAQQGDVVFALSDEALLPADGDATLDLYAIGPSGFPAAPVCTVNLPDEICDNCLDDDGDTAVDRSDPDCPPPANGGGIGLPDPKTLGKAAVKCQKALGKAGTKLAAAKLKRLHACQQGAFACLQLKPADDACVAKAAAKCGKSLAGAAADRAKLTAVVTKACGPPALESADLLGASGLGFAAEAEPCADRGVATLGSVADVAACVAATSACRAEALFALETPRAAELLALLGRDAATDAPCLGTSTDGGGQAVAEPGARKAVVKCQKAFAKAGSGYASQEQKLLQKCAAAVATCVQQKASDPGCLAKATKTCGKLAQKLVAAETKVGTTITKGCGGSVGVAGVVGSAGLGFGVQEPTCSGLGVGSLATLADVATCSVRLHACRAEQLLENQTPRLRELLDLGATPLD